MIDQLSSTLLTYLKENELWLEQASKPLGFSVQLDYRFSKTSSGSLLLTLDGPRVYEIEISASDYEKRRHSIQKAIWYVCEEKPRNIPELHELLNHYIPGLIKAAVQCSLCWGNGTISAIEAFFHEMSVKNPALSLNQIGKIMPADLQKGSEITCPLCM